jgi:hypothetical protein
LRRVKIFRLGRFLAFPDASSPPRLDRVKKSWNVKHRRSDSVLPDTLDTTHVHYASMSACAPTAESVPLVSSGRACRGGSAGVRKKYDLQLFSIVQTRPACTGATAENRLDAAPRRPRAAPAAPQLRTHRSRLPGRQRRLLEPAAASAAAPAAARLLLQTCRGPPETPERARERPPPAALAATPAAAPAHTLRPSPPLLPPPWQLLWRPQQSVESLYQAWQRAHRRGQKRGTNGQRTGQKGGNGRRGVARAGTVVVAAAGPVVAAWRRAGAAAGRVREAAGGREKGQHT